jgi:hypothetical protein
MTTISPEIRKKIISDIDRLDILGSKDRFSDCSRLYWTAVIVKKY